ncbi:gliotoxin biosynthesis protein [Sporothrix brasiliensis 5110]|uniref:gamma-glutamylcyclotransferase n=1 Tax=Sporothrix brasiliensis 5110 TaxID=1398154 RepID=A0A0C2IPG0_9PEZI|nr:gliotoxin biosynthesis protein [Sporothrix brasiliensis 5110]KIH90921.1 gliotoxin biosynthesis protein [Sporothrix brasiliensis 5110]
MAAQAPMTRCTSNEHNDVIIDFGDVEYSSASSTMADDTPPAPAGLAATVVRDAIEIDFDSAARADGATSSEEEASTATDPASPESSVTSTSTASTPKARRIPFTSAERLAKATPDVVPDEPVLVAKYFAQTQTQTGTASEKTALLASESSAGPADESTVLYLAYGSNMAASTFEGARRIKPLSCVTVSAPTLRLTFDLPGVPYREPCFANTAIRRPPKTPPKIPDVPDVPDVPDLPVPGPPGPPRNPPPRVGSHGDPIWDGPLYGVVYEVTREDYAKIIATEGGGASYQEILVPCLLVAPRMGVPEKPVVPVPPRPFLARTLFAPQLPADKKAVGQTEGGDGDDEDDDNGNGLARRWRAFVRRLVRFATVRTRPDPDYAQPSQRYLGLLTSGAADHELPQAYQDWLASLHPYTITSRRQAIGRVLLLAAAFPFLMLVLAAGRIPRKKGSSGRMPPAMLIAVGLVFGSVWWLYDHVFRVVFGDGERTQPTPGDAKGGDAKRVDEGGDEKKRIKG